MNTEVQTTAGRLRGERAGEAFVFRGVPFASPPVGDRRFRAPAPLERWDGVRDATHFGPAASQPPRLQAQQSMFAGLFGPGDLEVSEDCLYLNVWTPGLDDAKRPVLVWIHGGGFRTGTGASPMYDGAHLAERGDVVVVTINYRLGPIGFLYAEGLEGANFGTQDQVAALEWVQREIGGFGGDPGQVTIFGESAGGKSVETLLAAPAARGLFRRAIVQSTYDPPITLEAAREAAAALFAEIGIEAPTPERLRGLPLATIIDAQVRLAAAAAANVGGIGSQRGFVPVIDGEVLTTHPLDAIAAGSARDVALLIGTNRDESRLFGATLPAFAEMDDAALVTRFAAAATGGDTQVAARLIEAFRAARLRRGEAAAPSDLWFALQTERTFRWHSITVAEAQASAQPSTYMYLFSQASPLMGGILGACHGIEIPYVFGNFDGPLGRLVGETHATRALAEAMQDAWLAFARTGEPRASSLPTWVRFDARDRATMVLSDAPALEYAPRDEERAALAVERRVGANA